MYARRRAPPNNLISVSDCFASSRSYVVTIRSGKHETAKTRHFCKFQPTPSTDLSTRIVDKFGRDTLTNATFLRVALDTPLRRLFDYLPPREGVGSFTIAIRAAHAEGIHAMVYMN